MDNLPVAFSSPRTVAGALTYKDTSTAHKEDALYDRFQAKKQMKTLFWVKS